MSGCRMGSKIQAIPISGPIVKGTSDSFIVDLENLSKDGLDKDVIANSRVNMQRNFSRKGSMQGGDQESLLVSSSSSPRAGCSKSTAEKVMVEVALPMAMENSNSTSQAVIRPSSFPATSKSSSSSSKWGRRYNSFKRSSPPYWFSDPKRVLLFFATLSSIGTILLIYFTLYMSSSYGNGTDAER